jgi:hypothetical protein
MHLEFIKRQGNLFPLDESYLLQLTKEIERNIAAGLLVDNNLLEKDYWAKICLPTQFEYCIYSLENIKYCTIYPIINGILDAHSYLKYKIISKRQKLQEINTPIDIDTKKQEFLKAKVNIEKTRQEIQDLSLTVQDIVSKYIKEHPEEFEYMREHPEEFYNTIKGSGLTSYYPNNTNGIWTITERTKYSTWVNLRKDDE